MTQWALGKMIVSDELERLNFDVVHGFLTTAYWSVGVSRELVERAARHSVPFGVYDDGAQVGYARVVTDRTRFAYLADVFVLPTHRGRGLGALLLSCVLEHPELRDVRRFLLVTTDAHGLYERFGFTALTRPEKYMERLRHPGTSDDAEAAGRPDGSAG
ncbi:GNAT family N-acetyltransferase [Deinococcus pimensis]|uniref:GNAT family N-acetyltransferase n=1 Tax=Deinococcus pimensis TaxID=309888 RepID=UPI001B7FABF2|nr:GNAT family N-acetyltransferase [Deinococcus pimensis]